MAKVKLVRMPERSGLMRARMEGVRVATAEVGFSFNQTIHINIYIIIICIGQKSLICY